MCFGCFFGVLGCFESGFPGSVYQYWTILKVACLKSWIPHQLQAPACILIYSTLQIVLLYSTYFAMAEQRELLPLPPLCLTLNNSSLDWRQRLNNLLQSTHLGVNALQWQNQQVGGQHDGLWHSAAISELPIVHEISPSTN